MSVAFFRGQQLGSADLDICLESSASGSPVEPAEITYALYQVIGGQEVLLGVSRRVPETDRLGHYYASIVIPLDAGLGCYRIRWTMREKIGGPLNQVLQEFNVVDKNMGASPADVCMSGCESDLVRRLRILLRDNNPDRNYHFRPPAHEETVRQYNRVFGHIWEDYELLEYIRSGLDMVSAAPPRTPIPSCDVLVRNYPEWRTLVLNGAMMAAIFALQLNWIADEFDYSIGGVSLSIEKSSKYESAYSAIKDQFDKQLELAKQTVKITKGLQQPKYGIGIRSSFGPYVGSGVLSPRKFASF